MTKSPNQEVNTYLNDLKNSNSNQYQKTTAIRQLFLTNLAFTETIKYGGILFEKDNQPVGGIFGYKDHISIEFSNGVNLKDPKKILEGDGKFRRHLKIPDSENINIEQISSFINQL